MLVIVIKLLKSLSILKKNLNQFRKKVYQKYYVYVISNTVKKVGVNLNVNYYSSVTSNTFLGDNVNFNGMSITGDGEVHIGNNFHCGQGCSIWTSQHNYDHGTAIPYDDTYTHNNVIIEDNVWFGANVVVMTGRKPITIGEGAIIQYGSVVVSSIPPLSIAGGHPAKVFKYRDKAHYYDIKIKQLFK
jgi:acetyltransferase-like isoleucine patch superfamily enzyme